MNPGLPCQKEEMKGKRGQRQRNKWARSSTHSTLMRTEKENREGRMAGDRRMEGESKQRGEGGRRKQRGEDGKHR